MASRVFRRLASGVAASTSRAPIVPAAAPELQAIEVDDTGRVTRLGVRVGSGDGLLKSLHVRDRPLLERTGSFGDTPATMSTRPGLLLVRFQPFTAVIGETSALLMDAHRASPKAAAGAIAQSVGSNENQMENEFASVVHAIGAASAVDLDGRSHAGICESDTTNTTSTDFPLRALEAVLEEATGYYHQKMRRIKLLTDYCLETITEELKTPGWGPGTGEAGFQRLLPLRRAMTELESDIREAHHAISDAMRSDARVDGLLPGLRGVSTSEADAGNDSLERSDSGRETDADEYSASNSNESCAVTNRRAAVTSLLQTHLWRVRAAGGQLSELSRQVEATREAWELYLDGVRNRTVRLNLQATVATLALTVAAVPASLAGMNVPNGFENADPVLFWSIGGILAASSTAVWWSFMKAGSPKQGGMAGARVDDLRALRFVLQSMDELDDAMRLTTRVVSNDKQSLVDSLTAASFDETDAPESRSAAGRLAKRVQGLDDAALGLLFKVFDRDGDGAIDPHREWVIKPWPLEDDEK